MHKNRTGRKFKRILILTILLFLVYSVCCVLFIYVSEDENRLTEKRFSERSPDLIAVFTGDLGRIPFAVKKALEFKEAEIFITGVYSRNSLETLLKPLGVNDAVESSRFTIDYHARNTVGNVISTLRHLRQSSDTKKILIISHDYHIMRIKLIVDTMKTKEDDFEFSYLGIKTNYNKLRSIKLLYKEVFKLIRTYAFLKLMV